MTFLREVEEILRFRDPNCVKAILILRRAKRRGLKEENNDREQDR